MSTKRYLTTRDLPPQKPGCCRWCEKPLPPRCTSWCSRTCSDAFRLLGIVGAQREAVFERDRGVCATCGLDTWGLYEAAEAACEALWEAVRAGERQDWREHDRRRITNMERLRRLDALKAECHREIDGVRRRWNLLYKLHGVLWEGMRQRPPEAVWHMDHIVPVVEGGGVRFGMTREEVLANLRTLCIPCHKRETALLARRRSQSQLDEGLALFGGAA